MWQINNIIWTSFSVKNVQHRVFNESWWLAKLAGYCKWINATFFFMEITPKFMNNITNNCTEHKPWIGKVLSMNLNKRDAWILSNFSGDFCFWQWSRIEHTFLRQQSSTWCKVTDLPTTLFWLCDNSTLAQGLFGHCTQLYRMQRSLKGVMSRYFSVFSKLQNKFYRVFM